MKRTAISLFAGLSFSVCSALASAQMLSFASPPQGSVWNTMSTSIANVARSKQNLNVVVQPFSGNRAMMDAVDRGFAEFAINDVNDVIVAARGQADYTDRARRNLRVVLRISPQPVGMFVRKDSGIDSINDLAGKRVAAGWNAFPLGRPNMAALLATGGLTWSDVEQVPVPDLIRAVDNFASGRLDATFFAVGGPKVAEADASVGGVKFLPVATDEKSLEAISAIRPAYYFSVVKPAPHRAGLESPMEMVTWDNVLVAGADVSEEKVYQLVTAILENKDELVKLFPGFRELAVEEPYKVYPDLEYHPGAARYFKEKGLLEE